MSNIAQLPFKDQIEYFREKLNLPTQHWNDILDDAHEQAFTVAGAMESDLLNDLRKAVNEAIKEGIPLQEFRKQFKEIVAKRGWTGWTGEGTKKGEAWRSKVIYDTNIFSSHAAGRYKQQKEIADARPYWQYKHSHLSADPREQHLEWDGLILRHDDPFWATAYPPNGYGCKCYVVTLSEHNLRAMGKKPDKSPSRNQMARGVEPGFQYAPGAKAAEDAKKIADEKQANLDKDMAKARASAALQGEIKKAQKALVEEAAANALSRSIANAQQTALGFKFMKASQGKLGPFYKKAADALGVPNNQLDELAKSYKLSDEYLSKKAFYTSALLSDDLDAAMAIKGQLLKHPFYNAADISKIEERIKKANHNKVKVEQQIAASRQVTDTAAMDELRTLDGSDWVKIGGQGGSNPGGLYQNASGEKFYVKFIDPEWRDSEILTAKLYRLAGLNAPDVSQVKINGKVAVASRIIDGLEIKKQDLIDNKVAGVYDGFGSDAWLANWDVVGYDYDNLKVKEGIAYRIDTGGGLEFRAQGTKKGAAFGEDVTETTTLRDPSKNPRSAKVFAKMTKEQERASVERVANISDEKIRNTVLQYGPGTYEDRQALANKLIKRKESLKYQYALTEGKKAVKTAKMSPEHAAIKKEMLAVNKKVKAVLALYKKNAKAGYAWSQDDELVEVMAMVRQFTVAHGDKVKLQEHKDIIQSWEMITAELLEISLDASSGLKYPTPKLKAVLQQKIYDIKSFNLDEVAEITDDKLGTRYAQLGKPTIEEVKKTMEGVAKDYQIRSWKKEAKRKLRAKLRGHEIWEDIPEDELAFVYSWTSSFYSGIGRRMREPDFPDSTNPRDLAAKAYRDRLSDYIIAKDGKFKNTVYRRIKVKPHDWDEFIAKHKHSAETGSLVPNFHPESWSHRRDNWSGNVELIIEKPKMGVIVQPLAMCPSECEVMFPLMKYRVTKLEEHPGNKLTIWIEEVYE